MSVELTPSGSRSSKISRIPGLIMKPIMAVFKAVMRLRGTRLLELTTVGAKSGNQHTVTLSWFPDGENSWLIVASYGGTAKHPAWYINMAKNPDKILIDKGSGKISVRAESLHGAERATRWQRLIAEAPGYAAYQEQTDREIPLVRLTAAPVGK